MGLWSKVKGVFGRIGRGIKNIAAKAGAPIGAIVGSLIPGIGTALGTAIGGAAQTIANKF
jgi:hypothetical protein